MLPTRTPPLAIALGFALPIVAGWVVNIWRYPAWPMDGHWAGESIAADCRRVVSGVPLSSGGPAAEAVGSLSVGAVGLADPRPDAGASAYMDARSRMDGPTPSAPDRISSGGPAANAVGLLSVGAPAAPVGIPDAGADSAGSILTSPAVGAPSAANPTSPDHLLRAIERVESNGRADAVGDGGRAVGILQIHPCVIDDVNHLILRRNAYTLADRTDPVKSREIFRLYIDYWCYGWRDEDVARTWNGGPCGAMWDSTVGYWKRVKRAMEEQR